MPRAIVSAILEKQEAGKRMIFIQTRWKPQTSPTYTGLFEIPAGGIDGYENVYDALRREVKEETGLEITKIIDDYHGAAIESCPHDISHVFRPFLCQQVLETNGGLPWIGFVFRCEAEGTPVAQPDEARDPQWMAVEELERLLQQNPEKFFPLQLTTLLDYVDFLK